MSPRTVLDSSIPEPRAQDETRPLDVPRVRAFAPTGARVGAGIRLRRRIGEGASSIVYGGEYDEPSLCGTLVAVKVLRERCGAGPRRRFAREIEVLRRVGSPHVVRARERGTLPDGRPWLAMDYVRGCSLAERLACGWRPSPERAIRLLRMACMGLAAVHATGFVHHDVKPSNLLTSRLGGVEHLVVIDLGVAEPLESHPHELCGTPDYIAPEQAEIGPVDPRSDVYGLGCCAYELLTGRRLVCGGDASDKIRAHLRGVRPSWPEPTTPSPALRRLVERCLARYPDQRPPSMLALERALAAVLEPEPSVRRTEASEHAMTRAAV